MLRRGLLLIFLLPTLLAVPACTASRWDESPPSYRTDSIERPARELGDDDHVVDKAGKVLVAILVVGVAVAAIALPILLFL